MLRRGMMDTRSYDTRTGNENLMTDEAMRGVPVYEEAFSVRLIPLLEIRLA